MDKLQFLVLISVIPKMISVTIYSNVPKSLAYTVVFIRDASQVCAECTGHGHSIKPILTTERTACLYCAVSKTAVVAASSERK